MPGRPRPLCAPSITARFASSMEAARPAGSGVEGADAARVETAMVLATSPAACPPMPSATANSGKRTTKESSLCERMQPTSVRDPQASEPVALAAPEMRSVVAARGGVACWTGANGMVWEGFAPSTMSAASSMRSISAVVSASAVPGASSRCSTGPSSKAWGGSGRGDAAVPGASAPCAPAGSGAAGCGRSSGMSSSCGEGEVRVAGSGSSTSRAPSSVASAASASRASASCGSGACAVSAPGVAPAGPWGFGSSFIVASPVSRCHRSGQGRRRAGRSGRRAAGRWPWCRSWS